MNLGKRSLFGGFLAAAALLFIGSYAEQSLQAQEQSKKLDPTKNLPTFKEDARFRAAFQSAVAKASKSTVRVKSDGVDAALGVVLTAEGYILTKACDLKG